MEATQQKQQSTNRIPTYGNGGTAKPIETVAPRQIKFRDSETRNAIELLSQSNTGVLILGEGGVGKTSLVENIAYALTFPQAGELYDKQIVRIKIEDIYKFISTPFDVDNRICSAMNDIIAEGNIAFIDDVSAYTKENNIDLLLINNFVKSGAKVILCADTTFKGKSNLKNFGEIAISELTDEQTSEILSDATAKKAHLYDFEPNVLKKLVESASKYKWKLNKRTLHQPGSAFSLYNAVIAHEQYNYAQKHMKTHTRNWTENIQQDGEIDFNRLLLDKSNYHNEVLAKQTRATYDTTRKNVTIDSVYDVLHQFTGININALKSDSVAMLRSLGDTLKSQVFGQDDVIDKLTKSIKRNRLGVAKKKGAMCNYMFIGSTGTGKTFLAKKLAKELYGSEDNLLRYDMSEYSDEISVNKLIGAPPGYVGYTEGGMLVKDLEAHPQCVILFDEVEKAHPAIYNLLLQLLDEGYITDNTQRKASVKDCVIILTSNIGVKSALDYKSVGYGSDEKKKQQSDEAQKAIIENQLHKRFAPEFLNRLDGICYFENLGDAEFNRIYDRELTAGTEEIAELGYTLKTDKKVRTLIVEEAKKENLGARALLRVIQQKLLDVVTNIMIDNEGDKRVIQATVNKDNEITVKLASK